MNMSLSDFANLLSSHIGHQVRYRVDGNQSFVNDIIAGYNSNGNNIEIIMGQKKVTTYNVNEISYTEYEDRIDVWLYGTRTNRFNIYH